MFEMFVLLINEIHPHSFLLYYLFSFYLHAWSSPTQRTPSHHLLFCIFENLPQEFAARICPGIYRGDLPQEFAVRICRRNLLWVFATRVCRRDLPCLFSVGFLYIQGNPLFCISEQILFIWRQTFFIRVLNFLICQIFFINSFSSCYCRGSYGSL